MYVCGRCAGVRGGACARVRVRTLVREVFAIYDSTI